MSHLRLPPGPVDLTTIPTDATPDFKGGKAKGEKALAKLAGPLADFQERLFAEGRSGATRSLLLVLQGMDTSGKGGVMRHTVGLIDPQGVRITSFGPPTAAERRHGFLWRIRRALPEPGIVGVFDRSHYEDVLAARVQEVVTAQEVEGRYDEINAFEAELVESGMVVLKCMLHISPDAQQERLAKRLERPDKHWKYDPGDIDDRRRWADYQTAYEIALERTNTEVAPWHIIPADRKWFRNLAVGELLLGALSGMNPQWPEADFDIEAEQLRLSREDPLR